MNPKISITVDAKNKAIATLTGMVTVGAKVDVEIVGLPSGIPNWDAADDFYGPSLRFRVVDECGRDLVRFPLVKKSAAAATDGDQWTKTTQSGADTYNNASGTSVEFDTDAMRKEFSHVAYSDYREFGVILDSIVDDAQYAVGKMKVRQWAAASSEDPTVLPDWRETLAKLTDDLAAVDASKTAAAASATAAGQSAASASSSASAASGASSAASTSAGNAATSAATAQTAASHYPYVDANGHWKVWESGAWVDKGAAKGDKGDPGDVSQVLTGETMSANPTQRQIATALKKIWRELGGTVAIVVLSLAAFGDVTLDTEWQDVPPETKVGVVVDLGQGGGGGGGVSPSVVTGIVESASVTNAGAVAEAKADAAAKYQPKGNYATNASISNDFPIVTNAYTVSGANSKFMYVGKYPDFGDVRIYGCFSAEEDDLNKTQYKHGKIYGENFIGLKMYDLSFPLKTGTFAVTSDIPTSEDISNIATNASEAVVAANADYALTNLTGAAVSLASGQIGSATLTADTSVTLDFSQAANRSGDCLLYLVNNDPANDFDLIPTQTNGYHFVSTDLAKALTIGKATTNIVMFTRLKSDTVLVSKQEVK